MSVSLPIRKRGRPSGKNRRPLSAEERRGRNACYERERRDCLSRAFKDLVDELGSNEKITTKNLLLLATATILKAKKKAKKKRSIADLEFQNAQIEEELAQLEEQLGTVLSLEEWLNQPEEASAQI